MWLMKLSRAIDAINGAIGKAASYLVIISVFISAGNAIARRYFNLGSNGFLEAQWYLYSAVFLLAAAWALRSNEFVKVDVLYSHFSRRTQLRIEVFGTIFFLFPFCIMTIWLAWPIVENMIMTGEMSSSPGGLIRWPVWILMPIGFFLVLMQGISELIKRCFILAGKIPDPVLEADRASETFVMAEKQGDNAQGNDIGEAAK